MKLNNYSIYKNLRFIFLMLILLVLTLFLVDIKEIRSEDIQADYVADSLIDFTKNYNVPDGNYNVSVTGKDGDVIIYPIELINYTNDVTYSANVDSDGNEVSTTVQLGDETEEYKTLIVKYHKNLTIGTNVKLTASRYTNDLTYKKGMYIHVSGTLTNNGEISMTARGTNNKAGENVYLWKNADGSFEYVPARGAISFNTKCPKTTNCPGIDGVGRQSGAGGFGIYNTAYASYAGGDGTSYSGGTGSGTNGSGSSLGGTGGAGASTTDKAGGAGNPGGTGGYEYDGTSNGTGGLLILYANNYIDNGKITSNGVHGKRSNSGKYAGGSSGGGSINLFINNSITNESVSLYDKINANGGDYTYGSVGYGGSGGAGAISIGKIKDGQYYDIRKANANDDYTIIEGDSILKILEENDLKTGYYGFKIKEKNITYAVNLITFDGDQIWEENQTFGSEDDVATEKLEAKNMVVVKVNGNLTINSGVTVTTANTNYGGPKGLTLYVTGTLTNNGSISMTKRGAKATGEDVYLYKKYNGEYEYVPAVGSDGGYSSGRVGSNGSNGSNRSTGGGGSALNNVVSGSGTGSSYGGKGTSYSGGVGGGEGTNIVLYPISNIGGMGGIAITGSTTSNLVSGPGNPAGKSYGSTAIGSNGTGGLLTIYSNVYINNGTLLSEGTDGKKISGGNSSSASSGGGSINIFTNEIQAKGTASAAGGTSPSATYKGGNGGSGSVTYYEIPVFPELTGLKVNNIPVSNFEEDLPNKEFYFDLDPYDVRYEVEATGKPDYVTFNEMKGKIDPGETKTINVVATGKEGMISIYKLIIRHPFPAEHNSKLYRLDLERYEDTFDPVFHPLTNNYDIKILKNEIKLNVIAKAYDSEATIKIEGNKLMFDSFGTITVTVSEPNVEDTIYTINYQRSNDQYYPTEFDYTGDYQVYTAPWTTNYKLEIWGAQGGNNPESSKGGYGGYSTGKLKLEKGDKLYVYVGGSGDTGGPTGGWNGGGSRSLYNGGGGATDIRLIPGDWSDNESLLSRFIVAGGGGSEGINYIGTNGGGLIAETSVTGTPSVYGGSQTSAGIGGGFGYGGDGANVNNNYGGAGGGGWYGGGGVPSTLVEMGSYGGAGGSGFVLAEETAATTPEGYSVPSKYYLTDAQTKSQTSKTGDGAATISAETLSLNNYLSDLTVKNVENNKFYTLTPDFDLEETEYNLELLTDETYIEILASPKDETATIQGIGKYRVPSGTTTYPVTVTSESGDIKVCNINITREANTDSTVKDITITGLVESFCLKDSKYCKMTNDVDNSNKFSSDITEYNLTVPFEIRDLEFTVEKKNYFQNVSGDGIKKLNFGPNRIEIEVTSEDKNSTTTYVFNIERDITGDNYLTKLDIEVLEGVTQIYNYDYTGDVQEFIAPKTGTYKLETWGAQGGYRSDSTMGGTGGYSKGTIHLNQGEKLYIYVGGSGNTGGTSGGYNGGGPRSTYNGGGGATDIRLVSGDALSEKGLLSRIIVAGGGGSDGASNKPGKSGGGESGISATENYGSGGAGGTQTSGNAFGQGGSGTSANSGYGGAGGGGWYGGFGSTPDSSGDDDRGGGGGSGFINTEGAAVPEGYSASDHILTDATTLDGIQEIPSYGGLSTMIGNQGDGYAKISLLNEDGTVQTITERKKIDIEFASYKKDYSFKVNNDVEEIDLELETEDPNATYRVIERGNLTVSKIDDSKVTVGQLAVGTNIIEIEVTAANGETTTYVLNVYRVKNSNALLKSLTAIVDGLNKSNGGGSEDETELNIGFLDTKFDYYINAGFNDDIKVTGEAAESTTTVLVVSRTENYGKSQGWINLDKGLNEIDVITTAEDGITETYRLFITRLKNSDTTLKTLNEKNYTFNEDFSPATTDYTVTVEPETKSLSLTAEPTASTSTVRIKGNQNFKIGENLVTITVQAEDGSKLDYHITVTKKGSDNNYLSSLSVDKGTLTQKNDSSKGFDPEVDEYIVNVGHEVNEITVSGTVSDKLSTVTGLETYKNLVPGDNTINVKVTSETGKPKTYTIKVIKAYNTDNLLKAIYLSKGSLSTPFNPTENSYLVNLDTHIDEIEITVEKPEGSVVVGAINNVLKYTLVSGVTTKTITVISESGSPNNYYITINNPKSDNNNLKKLALKEAELSPDFDSGTLNYEAEVPYEITDVTVLYEAELKNLSTVSIDKPDSLVVGENTITVTVTSESNKTKDYTIKVTRKEEVEEDLTLKSLTLSPVGINYNGDPTYTVTVSHSVSEIEVEAEANDSSANVIINKTSSIGKNKKNYKLDVGINWVTIDVEKNGNKKTYRVQIEREESSESRLENIDVLNGTLKEPFSPDKTIYSVETEESSLRLDITKLYDGETYNVQGNSNFTVGSNTVIVLVTSADKTSTTTYTLNVIKTPNTNTELGSLEVVNKKIKPNFSAGTHDYYLTVPNEENSVVIKASAANELSKVKIIAMQQTTGGMQNTITAMQNLEVGLNEIVVKVVSESTSEDEYRLHITRKQNSDNNLSNLSVVNHAFNETFNENLTKYTMTLGYDEEEIDVEATASNKDATIDIDGITGIGTLNGKINLIKGKDITIPVIVTAQDGLIKTYKIVITRETPISSLLEDLSVKDYDLEPNFETDEEKIKYSVKVEYETTSLEFSNIDTLDPNATYTVSAKGTLTVGTVQNNKVTIGNLEVGYNEVNIEVNRKVDIWTELNTTYVIMIYRQSYSNTFLRKLTVKDKSDNTYLLDKDLSDNDQIYNLTVPNNISEVIITAIPKSDCTVSGNGEKSLNVGLNKIKIKVTSKAGNERTYTLNITREAEFDITIKSEIGKLTKLSDTTYTLLVDKSVTKILDENIVVTKKDITSNVTKTGDLELSTEGNNIYTINLESADKTKQKEYTINIVYEKDTDASVDIIPSTGELKETSTSNDYILDIFEDERYVSFIVNKHSEYAIVLTNNLTFELGEKEKEKEVQILVQAESGDIEVYTILIRKNKTREKYLEDITVTGYEEICTDCKVTPDFSETTYNYSLTVPNEINEVMFEITKKSENQKVTIYKENIATQRYTLETKINNYKVVVQNDLSEETTYYYKIERLKAGNNYLKSLKLTRPNIEFDDFDREKDSYETRVNTEYNTIDIEAIPEDRANAKVQINGTVLTGDTLENISLKEGINDISIKVRAENGKIKEYVVHVLRVPEDNNLLKTLTVSSGTIYKLSPEFKPWITNYTLSVPAEIDSVMVEGIADNPEKATVEGNGEYPLEGGKTTPITITVKTDKGKSKEYVISVTRPIDKNVYLEQLIVNNGTMTPDFKPKRKVYDVEIDENVEELDISYLKGKADSTVEIIDNKNLSNGDVVKVKVTSASLVYSTTYLLKIIKPLSTNNDLLKILVDDKELEGFTPSNTEYNLEYENAKTSVKIEGITFSPHAHVVSGNGTYTLIEGQTITVPLVVESESGEPKTYTINIYRKHNTYLSAIYTSEGEVQPFVKTKTEYTLNVDESVNVLTVLALKEAISDPNVKVITGNGNHNLTTNETEILIKVVYEGTTESTEYKLIVKKNEKENLYLKYLTVGEGILSPEFDKNKNDYEITIPNDKNTLSLDYAPEDSKSVATDEDNSSLQEGSIVKIKVTGALGVPNEYRITVHKEPAENYSSKLSSLSVTPGNLTPAFDKDTNLYHVLVPKDTKTVDIKAETEDPDADKEGDGTHLLSFKRNEFKIVVTSQDNRERTYTVVVTKEPSDDARVSKVEFTNATMTKKFNKDNEGPYELLIDHDESFLNIKTVEMVDKDASYEKDGDFSIIEEGNEIKIIGVAEDGITKKTYTFKLKVKISTNAYLKELTPSIGTLSPTLSPANNTYFVDVDSSATNISLTATPYSRHAKITPELQSSYNLTKENTIIPIMVKAENGVINPYTVIVRKVKSSNGKLADLRVEDYELTPKFDPNVDERLYTLTIEKDIEYVNIIAIPINKGAKVDGDGVQTLKEGLNTFPIIVTAEDGTQETYTIEITKEKLLSARILDLEIEEGVLDPENEPFDPDWTNYYTIKIPNEYTSITEHVVLEEKTATYEMIGNENFEEGVPKEVQIKVTSSDPTITRTYKLNVIRQQESNNYLSSLSVTPGKLSPEFKNDEDGKKIIRYTVNVGRDVNKINVQATPELASTKILRGLGDHDLEPGKNLIIVETESSAGVVRAYKIFVTREQDNNSYLSDLRINETTITGFNKTDLEYSVNLESEQKEIRVEGIRESSFSTINGENKDYDEKISVLPEGKTLILLVTAEDGTINAYTINFTREASTNNKILDIIPSVGTLSPTFNDEIEQEYTVNVPTDTNVISFDVITESKLAKVTGNENIILTGSTTPVTIVVEAEDGSKKQVKIKVIRGEEISRIDITVEKLTVVVGEGTTLPIDITPQGINAELEYVFDDETLAKYENGEIIGEKVGTTVLTVSAKENSNIRDSVVINVVEGKITSKVYKVEDKSQEIDGNTENYRIIIGEDPVKMKDGVPNKTLKDFVDNLENEEEYIKIYTKDGVEITDKTDYPKTGLMIKLEINGVVYDEAIIILKGDIDGDGEVKISDKGLLSRHILKNPRITGYQFYAGDIDEDGAIKISDKGKVGEFILGKIQTFN